MIGKKANIAVFIQNWAAIFSVFLLIVFFSVMMPSIFPTSSNMATILRSISITTVLAMALTVTLAVGGFDLAAGAGATMGSFLVMSLIIWFNIPLWIAIPYAIFGTMVLTGITMFLIVKCKIPDLLATCAMMFFLDGLSLSYSGGGAISSGMPRPDGQPSIGILPNVLKAMGTSPTIIIIMLVSVFFVHIFLNFTKYGRFIYAIGGNKIAARLSGISEKKYRIVAGMIAAFFVALAGILVASRNQSAQIAGGSAYQMPALSAVFIGRSVLGQNKPNAFGTLIGATLVGLLDNGLIMMSVPYYSLNAVKGIVLAIALASTYYTAKED
jgi:simple sugar transport system permease protein